MKTFMKLIFSAGFLLILLPTVAVSEPAAYAIPEDLSTILPSLSKLHQGRDVQTILQEIASYMLRVLELILRGLGFPEDIIKNLLQFIVDGVVSVLSQLTPEEVKMVELAAGEILGMLQTGNYDWEALQSNLFTIYTIMWPYVDPQFKHNISQIINIIIWIWDHLMLFPLMDEKMAPVALPTMSFARK